MTRIQTMYRRTKALALKLHRDEQGAEGIEKLLILAAIALPLLGLLLFFRNDLWDWVEGIWSDVKGEGEDAGGSTVL
ncbi:MAG: hypothetical protein GVY24_03450 [Planctomycetes bacterium]|jgi:Flp pilus assembly pilin Flp|nr:hypothetical protein [Planctomycetota bacterium]